MFHCDICFGTGYVWVSQPFPDDSYFMHETNDKCQACEGTGFFLGEPLNEDDVAEAWE